MSRRFDSRMGNFVSLGDALSSFAKENQLTNKLQSVNVVEHFISLLPEVQRPYIDKADFSNGILRAFISSAPLRKDLQMVAPSMCDMINEKMEATIVRKIVLL